MKKLSFYKSQGLNNDSEIFDYFMSSLRDSIFTWDYFVDFNKTISNTQKIKEELDILNSLLGVGIDDIDEQFIEMLIKHKKVRKALPILTAIRQDKLKSTHIIDNYETLDSTNKALLFNAKIPINESISTDLIDFFNMSGLKDLFINKRVNNLYDYCLGIEVGMDTNARKNRTGTNMENLVESKIHKFCEANNFKYLVQATKNKIMDKWSYEIEVDKIKRRFDFAILNSKNELTLIEVNYYSGGGSKLKATAGEYKELHTFLKNQNINFIWITDGLGWQTAKTALNETFTHNDYVINLDMIANGILDEIIA